MIINITTIAIRQRLYLDQTIDSLMQSDGRHLPVNLILGSSDTSHVEKYRGQFNVVVWDEAAEAQARAGRMRHNCNLNAIRSLRYGEDEHCLCCEDDIKFVPDWYRQLMLTIGEIGEADYILNLGQGCDQSPDKRYATHTRSYLVGAQGIFYPSKRLRDEVATYLEQNMNRGMNDALVGQYAKRHAALYNTTPVLVGHIGQVSSFTQPKPSVPASEPDRPVPANHGNEAGAVDAAAPPSQPMPPVHREVPLAVPPPRPRPDFQATPEIFVALLRASLGCGPPPDAARLAVCDWPGLTSLASHHGLVPVVYQALQSSSVPPEWLKRFKAQYVANVFHHQQVRTAIDEIGGAFARAQIPFVLTKGAALLRGLYPDAGLGGVDHIGLLVNESDVDSATAHLRHLDYAPRHAETAVYRRSASRLGIGLYRTQGSFPPVALHWRLFGPYPPCLFDLDVVRTQATPLPSAPSTPVMTPEHELLHCCLQLERRAVTYRSLIRQEDWLRLLLLPRDSGRLVSLYTIALYVQCPSLVDWERLVGTARDWAIDDRIHATLDLAQRVLGIGPPAEVLHALDRGRPQLAERLAHRILFTADRADHRRNVGSPRSRRSRWIAASARPLLRIVHGWTSAFPAHAYLRAKYPAAETTRARRGRHVRDLIPTLWTEARYRFDLRRRQRRFPTGNELP